MRGVEMNREVPEVLAAFGYGNEGRRGDVGRDEAAQVSSEMQGV